MGKFNFSVGDWVNGFLIAGIEKGNVTVECNYCHSLFEVRKYNLLKRKSDCCGCNVDNRRSAHVTDSLLTPIKKLDKRYHNAVVWLFKCECGKVKEGSINHYRRGNLRSCGCASKELERVSKGLDNRTKTRMYRIYRGMINRCKPGGSDSKWHGDLGVSVCDRWIRSFDNFKEDMEKGYAKDLTLDRIDSSGDYSKQNCRWATKAEQSYNQRTSIRSKTGVPGVRPYGRSKWQVTLQKNNKMLVREVFDDLDDAINFRRQQEIIYYGYNK